MRWLLTNVNPELGAIIEALTDISEKACLNSPNITNADRPTNLIEVLKEVQQVENQILLITKAYVPNREFIPSEKVPLNNTSLESFEKVCNNLSSRNKKLI